MRVALVVASLHSNRTITKTDFGTIDWDISVTGLTMLLVGEMWTLGL